MKLRFYVLFLFFLIGGKAYAQCFSYTVNACIDYDDYLHISGDSLWWQDFGGSPPGTHPGCNGQDVTVNGVNWFPWNSVYILPNSTHGCTMTATIIGCSNVCDIIQSPTLANGWHGIYEFNDEAPGGPHPYSIRFDFFCPTITTSPPNVYSCGGDSVPLFATGGGTYSWSPATGLSCTTCSNPVATVTQTTYYNVTVTDANNCSASKSITVNANPIYPNVTTTPSSCFGTNSGSAHVTYTGGNGTVSVTWSNGATGPLDNNLGGGNYTVYLADTSGCVDSSQFIIGGATVPITINGTVLDASCGFNNGSVTLNVTGGTAPYAYAWSNGGFNSPHKNLAPGSYTVTVTDNAGCTGTATFSISNTPALSLSAAITNDSCNGKSDGKIIVTPGGAPNYTYSVGWTMLGNTAYKRFLAAGNYSVTVTDANGCSGSATYAVTEPAILTASSTQTDFTCASGGTINVTPSGGTAPYTYNWGGGITTQNRTNLAAGTYHVTVTDHNACTTTLAATITSPAALSATQSHTNVTCGAGGTINVTPSGGTTPYTYLWNDGNTSQNRTNLSVGLYSVTVSDNNSCTVVLLDTLTLPAQLSLSQTHTNGSCGVGGGSITLTTIGGTAPIAFIWNDGNTNQNRTNLTAGTYAVTATDHNSCTDTLSVVITGSGTLNFTATQANENCLGGSTGTITTTTTGGMTPYSYVWGGSPITTPNRTNLATGTYDVTVTDNSGCSASLSVIITAPTAVTATTTQVNVLCFGQPTGVINVTPGGGTSPYTYLWNDNATTQSRTNIAANTYMVTVTDTKNCTVSTSATITQPAAALTVSTTPTNASCTGGSITTTVTGGTTTYSYLWNDNVTTANRTNLAAGTYTLTVTDQNACTATSSATITATPALSVTLASQTNVLCFGQSTGAINVTISGGATPYQYGWSDLVFTQNRSNIPAGTYTFGVMDADSCTATLVVTITQPASALTATQNDVDATCNGSNNGSITVTPAGGTNPDTYTWSDGGAPIPNRTGLAPGPYTVTITDANACTATLTYTVQQPAAIVVTLAQSNSSCGNNNNWSVNSTTTGGTAPYTYLWSDASTNQNDNGLGAGTYSVTVTDTKNCTGSATTTIIQPAPLSITATNTNVNCFGQNTATVTTSNTGGTAPFSYSWSNSATTQNLNNVGAGTYSVTTTDNSTCTASASVTVTQPASALTITATNTNEQCFGQSMANVTTTPGGGTTAYTYLWSNSATTQNLTGVAANTYTVTITDANGCKDSVSATVTQPQALTMSTTHTDIQCNGGGNNGSITVTEGGGSPPYTFLWNDNVTTQSRTNIAGGTYSVTATDANGCTSTASATVLTPDSLSMTSTFTNPICPTSDNTGNIILTVNGGTLPYQYAWSNGSTQPNLTQLTAGAYSVTVSDAHGCNINSTFNLVYQYNYTVNATATPGGTLLPGSSDTLGYILTGYAGTYTNMWSPVEGLDCSDCPNPIASPVRNTTYSVTVSGDSGCSVTSSVTILVSPDYNIFIPNVFTPNNDGVNDYFQAFYNPKEIQYAEVEVFDRIGEKVFESRDINFAWDGTFKGHPAPAGVYVYYLKLVYIDDYTPNLRKGTITLLR